MSMTPAEIMAASFARQKAAEEAKKNPQQNYQAEEPKEIDYFSGFKDDQYIPLRIIGLPWEHPDRKPTDCKLIMTSKVLADSGQYYLPVIWQWKMDFVKSKPIPDPDWILTRLYNDIMDFEWKNPTKEEREADPNVKGERVRKHATSAVFKRVDNNQKEGWTPQRFYPSARVIANVRDPLDLEFHKRTGKAKVLCSKVNSKQQEDGSIKYYPELGMPLSVYDEILRIAKMTSGYYDFDVAVLKYEIMKYRVYHGSAIEIPAKTKGQMSVEPLDLLGEPWTNLILENLDESFNVTRYSTMRKVLGGLFQDWDTYAKRDFRDQLEELANHEAEVYKAKLESQKKKDPESTSTQHPVKQPEVKVEAPTVTPKRGERKSAKAEMSDSDRFKKTFWGFDKLPEEERAYFNQIFNGFDADGKPTWKDKDPDGAALTLVPCKGGKYQPQTLKGCAYCGLNFDESDECGFETPF